MSKIFFALYFLALCFNTYPNTTYATENLNSVAFVVAQRDTTKINEILKKADFLVDENQIEKALKLYLQIIESSKKKNEIKTLLEVNDKVGSIFRKINNYQKSIDYKKKSLYYAYKLKDTSTIIQLNIDLGGNHFHLYAIDSVTNHQSLESLFLYNKIAKSYIRTDPKKYRKPQADQFNNLAIAYFYKKDYYKAETLIQKSLAISKELKDTIGQVLSLNTLAGNNLRLKKYQKAKDQYQEALDIVQTSNSNRKSKLKSIINYNLAWTYYKTKNYIAYEYLKKSNKISDSLRDAEFDAIITEIEAKHNVDIIKQNAAKKQLIQIQEKKRFQVIIIGLAISLVILILIFWIYSKNAKLKDENKDLLIEKTRLMKEKQIEHIESLTRIKILNATLDGKEAERRQIAETLHDSVSALLSAANLHLQASKNKVVGKIPIEIDKTQTIIDEASGKIRNLSHELISSVLLKFGLSYAIQDFCEKYSNTDLEITASTENLQRYDESFEIKTNNIIEELVNNLIKHSKASEGHINVMEYRKNLHIEIEDNGVGFDTSKKIESNGIGIHQIEARIKMMKGSFKIHSVMEEGTRIEFTIPITYR